VHVAKITVVRIFCYLRAMFQRAAFLLFVLFNACVHTHYLSGEVVRVADGDTFTMLVEGKQQRIRLHGIDCPERGQPFSRVATRFTKNLLASGTVRVQPTDTDRYGRIVGIVWINDTINLNERLLQAGLAWHYAHYDNNPDWAGIENKARMAQRGLWAEKDVTPPWEWRQRQRADRLRKQK